MERERALEIVKKHYSPDGVDDTLRRALESLIPELTESEDERIRKAIVCGMNVLKEQKKETFAAVPINDCLAWLEKQKEQKPDTRTVNDLQLLGFIYDLLAGLEWSKDYAMSKDECLRRLNDYRPQKPAEWKPTEEQFNYLAKAITTLGEKGDCKTAGVLNEIRKGLKCSFPDWKMSSGYPEEGCNVSLNGEVKKIQEWSEEDERNIRNLESILYYDKKLPEDIRVELGDFLKSLRPQPHWKPSEHQLSMLEAVILDPNNAGSESCHLALESLNEDLRKL